MRYLVTAIVDYEFVLVLNPMMGNTENTQVFGPFGSKEALMAFYIGESVEPYSDEGPNMFDGGSKTYRKSFRKGGPLEWMNPLTEQELVVPGTFGHGIHEQIGRTHSITSKVPL